MSVDDDSEDGPEAFAEEGVDPVAAPAPSRDILVIGASAGGVEALTTLVQGLPPELPAAIFVVLHVLPTGTSVLPAILARNCDLPVTAASDGDVIERGHVYVAPPDRHLMLTDGVVRVTAGPRENGHRPAIDPLFRSAARTFGPRVTGVVLSGSLDDGTLGMEMIKRHGGKTIVQDPADAIYPDMPASAARHVAVDHIAAVADIPELINSLLEAPIGENLPAPVSGGSNGAPNASNPRPPVRDAPDPALAEPADPVMKQGQPSGISCPECGGVLWEHGVGDLRHFRCQVGHAYTQASLISEQERSVEAALWAGIRSLEERADLHRRLARRSGDGHGMAVRFEQRARLAEEHARELRAAIEHLFPLDEHKSEAAP